LEKKKKNLVRQSKAYTQTQYERQLISDLACTSFHKLVRSQDSRLWGRNCTSCNSV